MENTVDEIDKAGNGKSDAQAIKANLLAAQLDEFRGLSTCITASAIEAFSPYPFNTGFADSSIRCQFQEFPPVVGYAATAHVRGARLPIDGRGYFYYDRREWWNHILTIPSPESSSSKISMNLRD